MTHEQMALWTLSLQLSIWKESNNIIIDSWLIFTFFPIHNVVYDKRTNKLNWIAWFIYTPTNNSWFLLCRTYSNHIQTPHAILKERIWRIWNNNVIILFSSKSIYLMKINTFLKILHVTKLVEMFHLSMTNCLQELKCEFIFIY